MKKIDHSATIKRLDNLRNFMELVSNIEHTIDKGTPVRITVHFEPRTDETKREYILDKMDTKPNKNRRFLDKVYIYNSDIISGVVSYLKKRVEQNNEHFTGLVIPKPEEKKAV